MIIQNILNKHVYSKEELIKHEIDNSHRNGKRQEELPTQECLISFKRGTSDDTFITRYFGNDNWSKCLTCKPYFSYITYLGGLQ
jgi:hypothetical protein